MINSIGYQNIVWAKGRKEDRRKDFFLNVKIEMLIAMRTKQKGIQSVLKMQW